MTAGEECDRGAANSDTDEGACRTDCTQMRCGDNRLDPGEVCDDDNLVRGDGCDMNCTPSRCGKWGGQLGRGV